MLAFGAITLLAGHVAHAPEPTAILNVSLAHAIHAWEGPKKPASHAHLSLPANETLFEGQERHVLMLVAARLVEKLFPGHAVHGKLPDTVLKVPMGHFSHQSGQIFVSTSVPCTCTSRIAI